MASPTPKRTQPTSRYPPRPANLTPEVVDPRWIVKALAISLAAALLCAYVSVCLLVRHGSWRGVLAPSATIDHTPAEFGLPFQTIAFDARDSGKPRLSAWWIPADAGDSMTGPTILYLHDGAGSLSNVNRNLQLLHRANVNIFALDYRGYGHSEGPHPTQQQMTQDSEAALDYLTGTRHLPAARIVPYGLGLGAVLAADLAKAHPELPALIIENPDPTQFNDRLHDPQTRLLPARLLLPDRFDIAATLPGAHQPKLLLADSFGLILWPRVQANQRLFRSASDPKMTVTLDSTNGATGTTDAADTADAAYLSTLRRFLDENVR